MGTTATLVAAGRTFVDDGLRARQALAAAGRQFADDGVRAAHVAQLHDVARQGDAVAGSLLPTYGNRFELVDNADDFISRLVADIRGAREQVNFTTYALHPGRPGGHVEAVTNALMDQARSGVRVTGILDQVGSGLLVPGARRSERLAFIDTLRDAGVDVRIKRVTPTRGGVDDYRLAIDHRKLYEIDGRVSWQGGMNLVDDWLPWHDTMLRAEGPTSAQAGALLAGRWRDLGGAVDDARMAVLERGLRAPVDDARYAALQLTNGNRHRRELTEHFIDTARATQDQLWVANPYLADPRAMRPIVDAAKAGRDVRLMLAPKAEKGVQLQDAFTDPLRRAWAYEVADAGGQVSLVPEFSHAKVWKRDDVVGVGSFNLDLSSTKRNYENALITNDPVAVAAVEGMFLGQQARGVTVGRDIVDQWAGLARMRERLGLRY